MNTPTIPVPAETFRQVEDALAFTARWSDGAHIKCLTETALASLKACENNLSGDRAARIASLEQHAASVPWSGAAPVTLRAFTPFQCDLCGLTFLGDENDSRCAGCMDGAASDTREWDALIDEVYNEGSEPNETPALTPWQLPEPPAGRRWHREDGWTADMLPDGWRPLLEGEAAVRADGDEFNSCEADGWMVTTGNMTDAWHYRTRRPLPVEAYGSPPASLTKQRSETAAAIAKPAPVLVPLGPEDVPTMSIIRRKGQTDEYGKPVYWHWRLISYVTGLGPVCADRSYDWGEMAKEYEINRPQHRDAAGNPTLWESCEKEVQP